MVTALSEQSGRGSLASAQGRILEQSVISIFSQKGFDIIQYSEWHKNPQNYGQELLLKNVPFKNIYGHDGFTEFLLKSKKYNMELRIECKWQQSPGSVDEKFPYLYLNCIEAMPENHIVIIIDGGGAKEGAIKWIKYATENKLYTSEQNMQKKIDVFNLSEFIRWANIIFR